MENEELLQAIKDVSSDLKARSQKDKTETEAKYNELKELAEKREQALTALNARFEEEKTSKEEANKQLRELQTSIDEISRRAEFMHNQRSEQVPFSERFANALKSDEIKEKRENYSKSRERFSMKFDKRAVTINLTPGVGDTYTGADVVMAPLRPEPALIRNYIPTQVTSKDSLNIWRVTNEDDVAAETVAMGGRKPEKNITMEVVPERVRKIAVYAKVEQELLDDIAGFQSLVENLLRIDLKRKESQQILEGPGTGTDLLGLLLQATDFSLTGTSLAGTQSEPTQIDVLESATALLFARNLIPDVALVHPFTMALMNMQKSTSDYLQKRAIVNGVMDINGATLISNSSVPQGSFLVGDMRGSARIYDRQQLTVSVFDQNEDDAIHNRVTILVEERLLLAVTRPDGIIRGTFAGATSQLQSA